MAENQTIYSRWDRLLEAQRELSLRAEEYGRLMAENAAEGAYPRKYDRANAQKAVFAAALRYGRLVSRYMRAARRG